MLRLFVAADLPDAIRASLGTLRTEIPGVRWLPHDQYHLTLRFLGDTPEPKRMDVEQALSLLTGEPAELALEQLAVFPALRRPRVLVVRMSESGSLAAVQREIERSMVGLGYEPETRAFTAHVTIARMKEPDPRRLGAFLDQVEPPVGVFRIDAFHLYESRLGRTGASYVRLHSFPLAGT